MIFNASSNAEAFPISFNGVHYFKNATLSGNAQSNANSQETHVQFLNRIRYLIFHPKYKPWELTWHFLVQLKWKSSPKQILKHISDTPIATRPWNVAKAKTVAYNEMALQLLALQCFSDLSTKPALSTVNDYLHKLHEESLKSALEYTEILSVFAFETPPTPYTLWKTGEGEILELGSIKSASLAFFNFTERQLADINNADYGTEERATVRTSLKLRELMIDLGQQELRASPEETATGRKRVQGVEKVYNYHLMGVKFDNF